MPPSNVHNQRFVLLAAGGTGGHLFPAMALAHVLVKRGYTVGLATDHRAKPFLHDFPASEVFFIKSATFGGKNPLAIIRAFLKLAQGYMQSRRLLGRLRPCLVMGFGGYPIVPVVVGAGHKNISLLLHEQNAIVGRANRFGCRWAEKLAIGFPLKGQKVDVQVVETGNPVRPNVIEAMKMAYISRNQDDPFRLLVFGGSQGARYFSDTVPPAIGMLDENLRSKIQLIQQARPEDRDRVFEHYKTLGVSCEVEAFFNDLPNKIAQSHLVIARGGASTVTELCVIGRPSILVPLPGSLDGDQAANAAGMEQAGGGWLAKQAELDAKKLSTMIEHAILQPKILEAMAKAAQKSSKPNAAQRLADLVDETLAHHNANP